MSLITLGESAAKIAPTRSAAVLPWCLLLAAVGIFFMTGCGKKSPPLPPVDYELPVIDDLSFRWENEGQLVLSWPQPDWDGPPGVALAGFKVYRAKVRLEEACEGCPVRYQLAGEVALEELAVVIGGDLEYRESLEKGWHYRYKVSAYTRTGREGPDSNSVRLDY